jgi:cysteinyl-tRNA synthetase
MGENPASGFKGLRLHNTLTRAKDDFVPIDAANVRVYVCGPTVYDDAHIGNARPAIVFDVLYRLLRHLYGADHVTYVRNITDVDDKIIDRARRDFPDMALNDAIAKVTAETEAQYHADVAALGCLKPDAEPRATEHIPEMVAMIRTLIENNNAYEAEGHVLFDVKGWKNAQGEAEYGKLSRRPLDEMIAGARVEVAPYKRDAMDFVLWKPSSAGEPGWDSPWGRGRPGWHLECSAMSEKHLGKIFDIHGGGVDLVFPHHENEIAQSRCAHGTEVMANYWMHNGFLQVEGRKMAKSEGNFVTIRDLLEDWPGDVLRYAMLMTNYRQPLDFTKDRLQTALFSLALWRETLGEETAESESKFNEDFFSIIKVDLNTSALHNFFAVMNKEAGAGNQEAKQALSAGLFFLGITLGDEKLVILSELGKVVAKRAVKVSSKKFRLEIRPPEIDADTQAWAEALIATRAAARTEKNWDEADRIRDELAEMGIQIMDAKDPETGELVTTWEVKR